jgi:8-oxo-dGTP pyrophosphatase MutT (NUDIX family)
MDMKHIHPCLDDNGKAVAICRPSLPSSMEAFADPEQIAVVVPKGNIPAVLNGVPLSVWSTAPTSLLEWANVSGQATFDESPMIPQLGKKLAAGVVAIEPDGRIWIMAPTNAFGGYQATFPKGTLDVGLSPQATAIKEAFEESGLQVEITGWIGDFERTTSVTRYYFARRVGGNPAAMGWESQAVMLVPKDKLSNVLNHSKDHELLAEIWVKHQA